MITCWNCGTCYRDCRAGEINGVYLDGQNVFCHNCGARPRMVKKSLFIETLIRLRPREARQFMDDAKFLTDDLTQFLLARVAKKPLAVDEIDKLWSAQPLRPKRLVTRAYHKRHDNAHAGSPRPV